MPSGSDALGWKAYAWPTAADVAGVPLMTGFRLTVVTVTENGASETLAVPSDTEIVMLLKVMPATLLLGVPVRRPVELLNVAQLGRLTMEYVSVLPSGSEALGWKAYAWPTVADVAGVPLMTGARLPVVTEIENGASETLAVPSDTEIEMLLNARPAKLLLGVPVSRPVELLKVAQVGLLVIENVSVLPSGSEAVG